MPKSTPPDITKFSRAIRNHYRLHGRTMPWRQTRDPYSILISEIMLQQTQVERVIPYYADFIKKFADFGALASASPHAVLRAWQGLGYNRRALFLHRLAREVIKRYHGLLPRDPALLIDLPGIGPATAAAVAAFAFNVPTAFIETNIRRVFIHFFFPEQDQRVSDTDIIQLVDRTMDRKNPREWYYALMDYGAYLGKSKKENPNRRSKTYARQSRFLGSDRQIRGAIIRFLLTHEHASSAQLADRCTTSPKRTLSIVRQLSQEGFITMRGSRITIIKNRNTL